ncbi:TrbG/VirB9 family P-type conjugative transfer protein [Croceibacterium sp. LX-88]|uniref:TrbG/VirB9 family P-type conjugative transfer protein n=1 Tax=Croceibacterium selenioxidans TaxID=2838833 RepID=A0ABS5W4H5_9SPHN|nr:TrbG/VirB9 family P-type conjugative transfer protein [Croceibacterium selenioxidans]MBT2134657.1 TrbG/VirB9 family P-type conjugative transfer protein [Croceibacterium selenioxidans]
MRAALKVLGALAATLSSGVLAQIAPIPGVDDPRLQTVAYDPSRPVRLVAFPGANLTVMLMPGDRIGRVVLSDQGAFEVRITAARDSLNILPLRPDASATLLVEGAQRRYEFDLDTGQGLAAAYVVRFVGSPQLPTPAYTPGMTRPSSDPSQWTGTYRLSGEQTLRPARMGDDGERTYIEWAANQSLPAVFGIGASGQEEVVDGYMREGVFTIDRVYSELVFRIDKLRVRARRIGSGR